MNEKLSSSDDDDDEPVLSSPDSTSDKNEVHNDVFHYTARKFQKVNHSVGPSPASSQRRRHHVDAVQTKLSLLEHQQQVRDRKLHKRLYIDHDDSSDDDMVNNAVPGSMQVPQVANGSTARHLPPSRAVNTVTIDISDDSDDEEKPSLVSLSALKQAPREVLEVLQKSQQAKNRLQIAQLYHAEDLEVQVEYLPNHIHKSTNTNGPLRPNGKLAELHHEASLAKSMKPNLGKKLQLTCRCQLKINGNNQPTLEKNFTVHENQHVSELMEKVAIAFSLPTAARVTLLFDGLVLDTKKTPASYEMEDGDLVDINASVIAMPTTNAAVASSTPVLPVGPKLSLTLRTKIDNKVHETSLKLGKNEVFQTLLDQYVKQQNIRGKCTLQFDGEVLGLDLTPSNYDMEDGDLIDVVR